MSAQELHRLASTPVEARGTQLRVTQLTKMGDDRNGSEPEPEPTPQADPWVSTNPYDMASPRPRVHGAGFAIESGSVYHHHHDHDYEPSDEDSDEGSNKSDAAAAALAVVAAVAAVAGGAVIVGAAVEGARFDGYADVASDHPVLLISHTGRRSWKRLNELNATDASLAERALISKHDGFVDERQRAPLDRVGFSYQLEAGAASLMTPYGARDMGFSMRAAVGYCPWQTLGLYWGGQFGSGDTTLAGNPTPFALNLRTYAQVEYWPLALGRLHAGPFAEVGVGQQLLDEATGTRSHFGASLALGMALQLEVTTRLALTLRASAMAWPTSNTPLGHSFTPALTLGVAVY